MSISSCFKDCLCYTNQATRPDRQAALTNRMAKRLWFKRGMNHSINKQPLFNSAAKHPHLPRAARGDEASLPGGGLVV